MIFGGPVPSHSPHGPKDAPAPTNDSKRQLPPVR